MTRSRQCSVVIAQYEGTVRIARRVFRHLLDQSLTPERRMEAFDLQRTRSELMVERKLRRRQLTDDGNVDITEPYLDRTAVSTICRARILDWLPYVAAARLAEDVPDDWARLLEIVHA
jgi:hypothetical protein